MPTAYWLLAYKTDPLLVEIDNFHHPARIHPGNGFHLQSLPLIFPPCMVLPCLRWQRFVQNLLNARKRECHLLLANRKVAKIFFKRRKFFTHASLCLWFLFCPLSHCSVKLGFNILQQLFQSQQFILRQRHTFPHLSRSTPVGLSIRGPVTDVVFRLAVVPTDKVEFL